MDDLGNGCTTHHAACACGEARHAAEVAALRAIVEGRTTPPTPAEMLAHWSAGGWWLVLGADGQLRSECVREDGDVFRGARRIIAADCDGRPCAWPVVEVDRG